MKKLSAILTVFVLSCGLVFAQSNDATVTQSGDNQDSYVEQLGMTNLSNVTQTSDNTGPQKSEVYQDGTNNIATVNQSQTGGGGNTPANEAYIEQLGSDNQSTQTEIAPGYNSGQKVWGYQDGTANILTQSITSGHTESLKSEQFGTGNEATQTASGSHNEGVVYQDGTENIAEQTLAGSNNGYMGAVIRIDQYGTTNYASQSFEGYGSSHMNNGVLYQDGDNNQGWQDGYGRNLNAQLNQVGDLNWSVQGQDGIGHTSVVDQTGNANVSTVTQSN